MELSPLFIEKYVRAALEEDLGRGFDVTSGTLIPAGEEAAVQIVAREDATLCGLIVALSAFSLIDSEFDLTIHAQDGDEIAKGDVIADITGSARSILTAERVALNFLSHLSGVATLTAAFVDQIADTGAEICDTRKTLPGLRSLQKYAVRTGGGSNHRFGLDDAILIKDNHIAVAGGVSQALGQASLLAGHMTKIEIEVDTLAQLEEVLEEGGAHVVMFDNFSIDDLNKAVPMCQGNITTEASGGITLNTVRAVAETGVDFISTGQITNSAPAIDFGLDMRSD